jgi:hypothetical protein
MVAEGSLLKLEYPHQKSPATYIRWAFYFMAVNESFASLQLFII